MPTCVKCNTYNNIERRTCKNCGQALIIEEGNICSVCTTVNGPYAKKCKKCGQILNSSKKHTGNSTVHEEHHDHEQWNRFNELLKSSYLYDSENQTFAEEKFSTKFSDGKIHFLLGDYPYIFDKADDLRDVFNLNVREVPDFIREKASILIRPLFERYSKNFNISLMDNTLGHDGILLSYYNEKGQLAASVNLPIYEHEIEEMIPDIINVCKNNKQFLSMYTNDMFVEVLNTMDTYKYHYEFIDGDGKEFTYKVGDKTITIHPYKDGESLKISYLNKHLILRKPDIEFISNIFLNWMFNIVVEPMTIGERMGEFLNESTGMFGKLKSYFNKSLYSTHYSLTENDNLVLHLVSENVVKFTFKELKTSVSVPVHPNMPYPEFDSLLETYIRLAENKDLIQYIKTIEGSTKNSVMISDVSTNGCKVTVRTVNVVISTIILNAETTYTEVAKFTNKINFLEQIIVDE